MRSKGFTLIEVMLALAVFGLAMTAVVGFNERAYVNEGKARRLTTAVQLASAKMVDTQLEIEKEIGKGSFPEDKSEEGQFERPFDDYKWKVELRKVELPLPPMGDTQNEGIQQTMKTMMKQITESVREIKLTISWKEMEKDRSFSLVTHITKI